MSRVAVVMLLAARNDVEVDTKDRHGRSPLSYAANEAVVKLLVARDVEVDTKDNHGRSPPSYAAERGIVKLLLWRHPENLALDVTHRSGVISRHKVTYIKQSWSRGVWES